MSTPSPKLTDTLLKRALAGRAEGEHTSGELVGDVLAAVEALPQGRPWSLQAAPLRSALPILLVAAALLLGLIGYAILAIGRGPNPVAANDIAFVTAEYGWSSGALTSEDPAISTVASRGGDPARLIDVPGAPDGAIQVRPPMDSNVVRVSSVPHWSPDGMRIAFRVYNRAPGIYVLKPDGSGLQRLTNLPEVDLALLENEHSPWPDGEMEWSPDGTEIAFAWRQRQSEPSDLFIVDVESGDIRRLVDRGPFLGHGWLDSTSFAWSPDGSQIAFVRFDDGRNSGLYVVNRDGTGQRRLSAADLVDPPDYGYWHTGLTWSPDGSRIAFVRSPWGLRTMYVINADGTGLHEIGGGWTGPEGGLEVLKWSPDGGHIAGWRLHGGRLLFVVAADGTDVQTFGLVDAFDWSADGSQLVFATFVPSADGGTRGIYVINSDGTGRHWLAEGELPSWSHAGASLLR